MFFNSTKNFPVDVGRNPQMLANWIGLGKKDFPTRPKRGGVNCKEHRLRVEKMANIRHDLKENASSDFTKNTIVKIERGVVGT